MSRPPLRLAAAGAALAGLVAFGAGCGSLYYGALERLGKPKREILADRVESGRAAQQEAREQFRAAYEAFQEVAGVSGGELEEVYERLRDEFEESEARAGAVRERIDAIEDVAERLFDEWEDELDQISSASLRARSAERLRETRRRYERLLAAMRRAEERMDPVLTAFRDRVLFLKHNLNARTVAGLEGTRAEVDRDVERLLAEMEDSIREADAFLAELERDG